MKNQQCELAVVDNRISVLIKILYDESYDLGYALRRHNARMASSQGKPIILQNVLQDWMSMRYDLSLERTAAVVHLQTVLMASAMLHEWQSKMEDMKAAKMKEMAKRIDTNLKKMKRALDLRDDIWAMGGFKGMFHDIEERNRTFSCFRDYITTTASSQAGQGTSDLSHIDGWDIPLMPKDGRNPPSQPDAPSWDPQPIVMMNQQQQNEADAQRRTAPGAHPPSSGGGADSSAGSTGASAKRPPFKQPPTSKPKPSTPPAPKEWVIAKVPTGYIFRTSSMPDHRNSDFITSAWMDEFNTFLLSIVQGPAAVATNITGWAQYLRRVTSYRCMVFGICNPGVVTEDAAALIKEEDWLKCYSHLVRTQMLTRTGCYFSTASMLMMIGQHDIEKANTSPLGAIKKQIANQLACRIVEFPSSTKSSDKLAGEFRSGTTILITDLMYRVGTSTGSHDMGMGLRDMGWTIEFYKIHESEKGRPIQQFLETIGKVKKFIAEGNLEEGTITVHIWLSLQFLHAQKPPHHVILENDFMQQFVKGVTDLDQDVSRPVIVAVNKDSMFNGVGSVTSRVAVEMIEALKSQGILVTSDQRMWRSMYSQFGMQFSCLNSTRNGSLGKTAIWSVVEKNLFRQRVFLMCATNRTYVSSLNEGAFKPEESGIDQKQLERVTGPTEVFRIASGEMTPGDYATADATIFQKGPPPGATTTRFTRDKRYKTRWIEPMVRTQELEPEATNQCMWFYMSTWIPPKSYVHSVESLRPWMRLRLAPPDQRTASTALPIRRITTEERPPRWRRESRCFCWLPG